MATTTTPSRRRRRSRYDLVPRWLSVRRVVAIATVAAVVVVGAWGTRVVLGVARLFHTDPITAARALVGIDGQSDVARAQQDGRRINIALYGYGGPGHDGAWLADSIMVVSIQPEPNGPPRIAEISIPRDWFVPIDLGNGRSAMGRINQAYASGRTGAPFHSDVYHGDQGGGQMADATLERMLGIRIDYFIGIDFTAFRDAVDSVGGIDVDVPRTFTDNNYPSDACDRGGAGCGPITIHFDAGRQHMDGERALIYSRSRESSDPREGSNFARNKRQQLVLNAVKARVLSVGGLGSLPDLLNSLGDHVVMDLPINDAKSLYDMVKGVDTTSIEHVGIDDNNFIYECGYPRNCDSAVEYPHDRTFASVSHFIQNLFVPQDALGEQAPVTLYDGSGRENGASGRWSTLLGELGMATRDGRGAPRSATTRVVDLSGGRDAKTAQWLATYLGVRVEPPGAVSLPDSASSSQGVVVVLGADEEAAFNNPARGLYTA